VALRVIALSIIVDGGRRWRATPEGQAALLVGAALG